MRKLFLAAALFIWFPQILSAQAGKVVLPCPANNQPYLTTRDSQDQLRQVICENLYNGSLTIQNTFLAGSACNGSTIICAETMLGNNWGAKVSAAFALLPVTGGTVDARGLSGMDTITSTVTVPPNVTLLVGKSQIYCSVTPCLNYQYGDRILGMNPFVDWFSTNLAGTVFWENGLSGVLVATTGSPIFSELGNFAVANQTSVTSGTIVNTGVGIMTDGANSSNFHDLQTIGFVDGFATDAYGNGTYYNSYDRISATNCTYACFVIGPITNSNSFNNLTLMPQVTAGPTYMANALAVMGGSGDTIGHVDMQNFNDSLGVAVGISGTATSSGTGGNTLTWVSGQQFDSSGLWSTVGTPWGIQYNGSNYPIASCASATVCTVTGNPGAHTNLPFYINNPGGGRAGGSQNSISSSGDMEAGGTTSNVTCSGTPTVTWASGGKFMTGNIWSSSPFGAWTPGWGTYIGTGIYSGGSWYAISAVASPTSMTLSTNCPTGSWVATTNAVVYYNSQLSTNTGWDVTIGGVIYAWKGLQVAGYGLPVTVFDNASNPFVISAGGSLASTLLYADPNSGDNSGYDVDVWIEQPGTGGSGTATVTIGYPDMLIGGANVWTLSLALQSTHTQTWGHFMVRCACGNGGAGMTISSAGGTGAAYDIITTIKKIG
ncbi:MAG: hypothetical protein ABSA41_12515 [Terriglobia bacterium]|jgi:hypothetical protein